MCGRYNIIDSPHVRALMIAVGMEPISIPTRYNVAPTEQVPTIHMVDGQPRLSEMRWWLTPHWSDGPSTKYAMFNARSESVEKSRAFQGPFKYRRAIIPAASFIEWKKAPDGKQPYLISPVGSVLAFAGVWDHWSDGTTEILSCSILTTDARSNFKELHGRMPVLLDADNAMKWLDEKTAIEDVRSMLTPSQIRLIANPIRSSIGNARYKDEPELIGEAIEV